jgi:competence protein ComEC
MNQPDVRFARCWIVSMAGRSMRLEILAFAAGVWLLQQMPALPCVGCVGAGALIAACAWWFASRRIRCRTVARGVGSLAAFVIGSAWAAGVAHWRLADWLDRQWEGQDIVVTGVVASLPQSFPRGVRFEFDVENAIPAGAKLPRRVLLSWYDGLTPAEFEIVEPLRAGERWQFTTRLRRPHGLINPHGFDYEAWLLERGIGATGYVAARGVPSRLARFVARPAYAIERLREHVRDKFRSALPDHQYAGVLIALAVGDQRAIGPDEWRMFTRTGVNHLMSISGLHVTMVSGLAALAVFGAWRRSTSLTLRLPARKAAAAAGVLAALLYCLLAGFAIPAQRTLYMVAVAATALWLDRMQSASKVLSVALLAVLVIDPWAVIAPGFWLSFGAVAAIFYAGAGNYRRLDWLRAWARMQWAVTIGLAPLLLVLFKQVSLVSPLANAVAIPVVSLVVTPLALASALWPGDVLARFAHWILAGLMVFIGWLAGLPGVVWQQHAPIWWTVPLALIGIAWILSPRGTPARYAGTLLVLPLFAVAPAPLATGSARFTFLDVGQGLATVVRTAHHALLYDTGPAYGLQSDAGERVVVPFLRGEGIAALDALVVTHSDTDHSGGAASVARAIPANLLLSSIGNTHPVHDLVPYRLPCYAGQRWNWDGVEFAVLHPPVERHGDPRARPNSRSCVMRVQTAHGAVLLTSDIEARDESALLTVGRPLTARVALVPHHGSRTSSTARFVAAIGAEHAVFTVGYGNRFGHPKADVYARYAGARRWRTDLDGAVTLEMGSQGLTVAGQRERERRYWREARSGRRTSVPRRGPRIIRRVTRKKR